MTKKTKPKIGLVLGDPCGIGPEVTAKLVACEDVRERGDIVIIADIQVYELGQKIAGVHTTCNTVDTVTVEMFNKHQLLLLTEPLFDMDSEGFAVGKVSKAAGKYQLACLEKALKMCTDGVIDGFCFAPLNKEAMHLAGLAHDDEQGFFREQIGHKGELGFLNTLGNLWTSRTTSHVPLRQISDLITSESVLKAIRLLDAALRSTGKNEPVIAVAGLNPHAGDGGVFGDEEIKEIEPAVKQAQQQGINAVGPFPPDTIFLRGRNGEFDAIVTMYHDQGQIAMKLMGFDHGVTLHAGLPFPVTTSAHGSAFDIAGKGVASANALREAFFLACSMTNLV